MNNKNLFKIAKISGWMLIIVLVLYFISGYAMIHKYGMDVLMTRSQAHSWHNYLAIPLLTLLLLHIAPYYYTRKRLKRLMVLLFLVIIIPALSVLAINKLQKTESKPQNTEQKQTKAVRCDNCPNNCLIQPNKTGKCGHYTNKNGEIVPVEKTPSR